MIGNYEIRENSLTQNSVFLLLVKADEKGCEDIKRELSSFCKLIDEKVKGFDYAFELSGITDDSMLEKVRAKLDVIAASALGVTQTFDNMNKTATIDIDSTTVGKEAFEAENVSATEDIQEEAPTNGTVAAFINKDTTARINLADTGFPIEKEEEREEVNFKEVSADSSLISGDEKRIEIGDTSLRLVQTIPTMRKEEPAENIQIKDFSSNENNQNKHELHKLSAVEEENKTIVSYSDEEIKNVSMTLEKQKTGLLSGFFGKIKSAMHTKHNHQKEAPKTQSNEQEALSGLIKGANPARQENVQASSKDQQLSQKKEKNPFQDLGEGIIVKKGLLEEETTSTSVRQDRLDLSSNSVTAKLQVDDIFAAETVCDFYANQPGGQAEPAPIFEKRQTPLEALEKANVKEETKEPTVIPVTEKEKTVPTQTKPTEPAQTQPAQTKSTEQEITRKIASIEETQTKSKGGITLPDQIFTKQNLDEEKEENLPERGNVSSSNNAQKEEKVFPKMQSIDMNKEKHNDQPKPKKEEPALRPLQAKENKTMNEEKKELPPLPVKQGVNPNLTSRMKTQSSKLKSGGKIDHTLHVATPSNTAKYRNYPIEMPLIPTYTFANMDISSIRFAHAMAMATLDDLGKSNNPFLLQGSSGTGKTHFLHAMGYEISKKIPQSKILFTNGVRLSRGVQYSLEKGEKAKLDEFFGNAEVLIIDDVHLTAVNEHNREYISKILNDFLKSKKQIVMSSKYPPESLKRFEELVNFKFSLGAIAELKVPSKAHFVRLTNKIVSESFLDLTEQQIQNFFSENNDSLGDVARNVKRVKVLSRRIESSGIKKMSYEEILKAMTAINGEDENSEIAKKDFSEITALERNKENSWGNFGFFFPASQIDKFRWVAFAAQEAAKNLGIKGGFNYALKSAYSTEHIISAAFKIANICDLKGLKGAVILGPAFVECKEPIRDNFYDILTHMLEVMMIRCGTINFEDIKKPSAYIKMLGDILK